MTLHVNTEPSGVLTIGVEGQLIVSNRQELKEVVLNAIEDGTNRVVVDFSNTSYIDSSGLGVLVSISKKIREAGGDLRLSGMNDDLRMLFELTKLDTLFRIADSQAAAVQELT